MLTSISPCVPLGKCLSSCYPRAGAQNEWVGVCASVCGFFKRDCLGLQSFFHCFNPHWFLPPEVMGTYLPGTGTLAGWPGVDLGLLTPEISLLNFYLPCMGEESAILHLHPSYQSGRRWFLQFCSCQTSIQLQIWWFCVMVVPYFRCNFAVFVRRGKPCLPMLPSWPEVQLFFIDSCNSRNSLFFSLLQSKKPV